MCMAIASVRLKPRTRCARLLKIEAARCLATCSGSFPSRADCRKKASVAASRRDRTKVDESRGVSAARSTEYDEREICTPGFGPARLECQVCSGETDFVSDDPIGVVQ